MGGDTDTNACIVGSLSEAMYGIEPSLIEEVRKKVPKNFSELLDQGYQKVKNLR